jgi:hypothetical protein
LRWQEAQILARASAVLMDASGQPPLGMRRWSNIVASQRTTRSLILSSGVTPAGHWLSSGSGAHRSGHLLQKYASKSASMSPGGIPFSMRQLKIASCSNFHVNALMVTFSDTGNLSPPGGPTKRFILIAANVRRYRPMARRKIVLRWRETGHVRRQHISTQ